MTLSELKIGTAGVIWSVGGEKLLRRRLLDMGLTPGTRIFVRKMAPLGDPIELMLRGYELTLRRADAANIEVIPEDPAEAGSCKDCSSCGKRGRCGRC